MSSIVTAAAAAISGQRPGSTTVGSPMVVTQLASRRSIGLPKAPTRVAWTMAGRRPDLVSRTRVSCGVARSRQLSGEGKKVADGDDPGPFVEPERQQVPLVARDEVFGGAGLRRGQKVVVMRIRADCHGGQVGHQEGDRAQVVD